MVDVYGVLLCGRRFCQSAGMSFARPAIAFSLSQSGSRQLRLPAAIAGVASARWRSLFGAAFAEQATYVTVGDDALTVRGWIAGPTLGSNQSDLQFLARRFFESHSIFWPTR